MPWSLRNLLFFWIHRTIDEIRCCKCCLFNFRQLSLLNFSSQIKLTLFSSANGDVPLILFSFKSWMQLYLKWITKLAGFFWFPLNPQFFNSIWFWLAASLSWKDEIRCRKFVTLEVIDFLMFAFKGLERKSASSTSKAEKGLSWNKYRKKL